MSLLSPLLFLAAAPFSGPFLALSLSPVARFIVAAPAPAVEGGVGGGELVSALGAGAGAGAHRPGRAHARMQGSDFLQDHSGLVLVRISRNCIFLNLATE